MNEPMKPRFMEPPPVHYRDEAWASTVAALVARSGEWALIFVGDAQDAETLAGRVRRQRGPWAGHRWKVATRKSLDRRSSERQVYAQHIADAREEQQ